jgi:putative tryptophan/tyrosine transport system substrate-binding protein
MKRREFIALLGGAAASAPLAARAQQVKVRRLGVLSQGSISTHPTPSFRAFLEALREAGWREGKNLTIEWRFSEGGSESLPRLANELIGLQVELIVATPTRPALVAKQATATIPIVFAQVADPIGAGIVTNLARPEANITGMSSLAADMGGKRLALLKEMLPGASRIAVLWNRPSQGAASIFREFESSSKLLGLELKDVGISQAAELERAFEEVVEARSAAIAVIDDPAILGYKDQIHRLAAARGLPTFSQSSEFVAGGGLMSYGPNLLDLHRHAVRYVDRILRGAKPAELPVEQPTTFEMVINLKTAKTLGIEVPANLLARADEVIE